ncbi:hypothetical protein A2533_01085 [Candidatus Falkowbacteria bacterium RIFOXYD2_FULL_35_9]|uniref:Uncharacterized protein n=1 Tax=Candidatus Falkowbacteria bacterium RIFOXYC2_FULL_36_12 TaxID=1798002 RepID=A0A1F5T355_9BACT|nr:MAG: hypothetical protein A2300_01305 [Candidatus Falkowbacteria bacterium RIFOXYB2_FULL_35_7]OGF33342.1 MAG: hypothetical protein A2478_01415 [Candidatus Falkowbacteria bacterium RIFOXYC2_FULL_36_12]OGF34225.1 MAG: hypothetical protein A2223_03730 [Candidatus Falkowbacteria bacterium RIFOXYA2_FULL_35_8]OGF47908.1 MAG: hypothetical protein A2533_01085 [Candidatus Falkowbacteria bacterium RIFOXYD2_FULL_35_9]
MFIKLVEFLQFTASRESKIHSDLLKNILIKNKYKPMNKSFKFEKKVSIETNNPLAKAAVIIVSVIILVVIIGLVIYSNK